MQTLVIDRRDASLESEGGRLVLRLPDTRKPASIPLALLERVVVCSAIDIRSSALLALSRAGVPLVLVDGRGKGDALLQPLRGHGDAQRRLAQYDRVRDEVYALRAARALVRGRLLGALRALRQLTRDGGTGTDTLNTTERLLRDACRSASRAPNLATLRGIEGSAARAWLGAWTQKLPPDTGFAGRNRRPPRDPVNAALSLTFTLVHADAVHQLNAHGLDPAIGVYHRPAWSRDSLACDLTELLRADAELFVLGLFRERTLVPAHFRREQNGACLLAKEGRPLYYAALSRQRPAWTRRLAAFAAAWAGSLSPDAPVAANDELFPEGHD